jgi:hypothetical protein
VAPPLPVRGLDETALRQGAAAAAANDEVIEDPDVDERQRIAQACGDDLIRLARLRDAVALCRSAHLTTSRGWTLAPSTVPANRISLATIR